MRKILIGAATLILVAGPSSAQTAYPFHVQYTYLDANGGFAGRFTVYCNGREVTEGIVTSSYRVSYGRCDAP